MMMTIDDMTQMPQIMAFEWASGLAKESPFIIC